MPGAGRIPAPSPMRLLQSLAILLAASLLLFSSSCSGGGSSSGDGSGSGGGGTTTPNFGTGASYATLTVELPDHGLPNQASVNVTWTPADGIPTEGSPVEGTGTVMTASAIGVFVPELPEGSFTVSLSYEGAPVMAGTFESTGTVVPDEAAQYISDQLDVFVAALADVRQQVEAGELPMDLLGFLDEGEMRLAEAQDELLLATPAEIEVTAAWLTANADLFALLLGETDPLSSADLCPPASDTDMFERLRSLGPGVVAGSVVIGAGVAVAALGLIPAIGAVGFAIGGGIALGGGAIVFEQIDSIGDAITSFGQPFQTCQTLLLNGEPLTGVRPSQAFTVTLQGPARGIEMSDTSSPQEELANLAVALDESLLGLVDQVSQIVEELELDPATAPEVPSLPGVGAVDTLKMDPANVQWMTAAGDISGPVDVTYTIAGDSLEITLEGGVPGENIAIDYGYEQVGVSLPSTQRIDVTMQNDFSYNFFGTYTSVNTGNTISGGDPKKGTDWSVSCSSECQCAVGDTFEALISIRVDPYMGLAWLTLPPGDNRPEP